MRILHAKPSKNTKRPPDTPSVKKQEEWIWVEGYKGLTDSMTGHNNFQFELNKEYNVEEPVEICKNGFHFCLELKDVFHYYSWEKNHRNRYFKVKALVREQDADRYGERDANCYGPYINYSLIDKLVAKQIILTEEITESQEIIDAINAYYHLNFKIEDITMLQTIKKLGYKTYWMKKFEFSLKDKYSETFIRVFMEKLRTEYEDIIDIKRKVDEAIAYYDEELSKDMAVYLLMKD